MRMTEAQLKKVILEEIKKELSEVWGRSELSTQIAPIDQTKQPPSASQKYSDLDTKVQAALKSALGDNWENDKIARAAVEKALGAAPSPRGGIASVIGTSQRPASPTQRARELKS